VAAMRLASAGGKRSYKQAAIPFESHPDIPEGAAGHRDFD